MEAITAVEEVAVTAVADTAVEDTAVASVIGSVSPFNFHEPTRNSSERVYWNLPCRWETLEQGSQRYPKANGKAPLYRSLKRTSTRSIRQ